MLLLEASSISFCSNSLQFDGWCYMIHFLRRFFCALVFESLLYVQTMKRYSVTSMFKAFSFPRSIIFNFLEST